MIKDLFIPTEKNNYTPHLLGNKFLAVVVVALSIVNFLTPNIFPSLVSKTYASSISADDLIALANSDRTKEGLGSLTKNSKLTAAAKAKAGANANYSDWSDAKRRETFNKAGIVLHENYWEVFGSDGKYTDSLSVVKKLVTDFGSMENWMSDFSATAKSALGWCVLVYDPSDDMMHNVLVDYHNNGAMWGSKVIIALDVFEHAYYKDYGPDRGTYIKKFMESLDWKSIDSIFSK